MSTGWYWQQVGVGIVRCPYRRGEERQPLPTPIDYLRARSHAGAMRRAIEIAELRRDGMTYAAIGARLGVSTERVRQLFFAYGNWTNPPGGQSPDLPPAARQGTPRRDPAPSATPTIGAR